MLENGIIIICKNCSHEWNYKGTSEYYTSCPKCLYRVNLKKRPKYIIELEQNIIQLYKDHNLLPPKKILPQLIIDGTKAETIFLTQLRNKIMDIKNSGIIILNEQTNKLDLTRRKESERKAANYQNYLESKGINFKKLEELNNEQYGF